MSDAGGNSFTLFLSVVYVRSAKLKTDPINVKYLPLLVASAGLLTLTTAFRKPTGGKCYVVSS